MKIIVIFLVSMATSFYALTVQAGEWVSKQSVYRVYPNASSVYISTSSTHVNPDGCVSKNNYRLDPENQMFDKQYQALLTALAADRKVSLYISGCIGSYPRISHVIVY